MELRTETRMMPVRLTDEELRQKADELAYSVQEIADEGDRQKNIKDQMKARMSELTSKQRRLALVVSRKEEFRDVEIGIELGADNQVKEVRKDTGEVILMRPVRDSERQYSLAE